MHCQPPILVKMSTVIGAPSSPFRGRHTTNPGSNGPVNAKENCPLQFSFVPSGDAADAPRTGRVVALLYQTGLSAEKCVTMS